MTLQSRVNARKKLGNQPVHPSCPAPKPAKSGAAPAKKKLVVCRQGERRGTKPGTSVGKRTPHFTPSIVRLGLQLLVVSLFFLLLHVSAAFARRLSLEPWNSKLELAADYRANDSGAWTRGAPRVIIIVEVPHRGRLLFYPSSPSLIPPTSSSAPASTFASLAAFPIA